MSNNIEIKVPVLPESVADATIAAWHKRPGEKITKDENLVDIETDKVVLEVVAPVDGIVSSIIKKEGDTVLADEMIALVEENKLSIPIVTRGPAIVTDQHPIQKVKVNAVAATAPQKPQVPAKQQLKQQEKAAPTQPKAKPPVQVQTKQPPAQAKPQTQVKEQPVSVPRFASPAIARVLAKRQINPAVLTATGVNGVITKDDVINYVKRQYAAKNKDPNTAKLDLENLNKDLNSVANGIASNRQEQRVPMSKIRSTIAERLVHAQNNAAILTTFNEVNMQPIIDLRIKYKDKFAQAYGVKLGIMSFFVVAVVEALKQFPILNASIDGHDIVYHNYHDIGVAVSSERGLVVPVLHNAENLTFAKIEQKILEFSDKAKSGKLSVEEITGGTFTISNGGVFGSLMSTPILNPPQSGILGMHKIIQRAVVENNQIIIRPMMYLALSYDHRLVDGAGAVSFLLSVKNILEDPTRMLLHI